MTLTTTEPAAIVEHRPDRTPAAAGEADSGTSARLRVFRGEAAGPSRFDEFDVPVGEGMVVLDALHWIQANAAPDLAVRWNCKAAKCGSCSAEVNGRPRLTCKTRLSDFDLSEEIVVEPMRTFPLIRDLVTDVSWNYAVNRSLEPFTPPAAIPQSDWRWQQEDIERVQEFRKCIECFLCQDVCHVLRNHETERPFMGPRFLVRTAGLEMHPIDQADRRRYLKDVGGVGYCNITKCCTEVCPEHIKITDNAIIPLKERVADEFYDPIQWFWRKLRGGGSSSADRVELPVLHGSSHGSAAQVRAPEAEGDGGVAVAEPPPPEPAVPARPARTARPRTKPAKPAVAAGPVPAPEDGAELAAKPKRASSRSTGPASTGPS